MASRVKDFSTDLKKHLGEMADLGITEVPFDTKGIKKVAPKPSAAPTQKLEGGLKAIRDEIGDCQRCQLSKTRTNIVFGDGNPNAELMFIGEAPGRDEDLQGKPFVGRAGQLLTRMIEAMGYARSDVYIANIVKCRPPENRYPEEDESSTCSPFLFQQIEAIKPKVIVVLGNLATQTLLETKQGITTLRGKFLDYRGSKLMPTFHPAFLLRNPPMKKPCWEDLKMVMAELKKS